MNVHGHGREVEDSAAKEAEQLQSYRIQSITDRGAKVTDGEGRDEK